MIGLHSPSVRALQLIHGYLAVFWVALGVPVSILAFAFPDNRYLLAFVVFVSCYANFAGHAAAWQATRVEDQQGRGT